MSTRPSFLRCLLPVLLCSVLLPACGSQRKASAGEISPRPDKQLLGEQTRGWLQYQFFLHSASPYKTAQRGKGLELVMSIMVVNKQDATSPLRKVCTGLADYNTRYEYLLNEARNDIVIEWAGHVYYPVYYAFENNYNTMPFETINIGFRTDKTFRKPDGAPVLRFIDVAVGADTVSFQLPLGVLPGVR